MAEYTNIPFIETLIPRKPGAGAETNLDRYSESNLPQLGTPYKLHRQAFLSETGFPCIKPPWGGILAVDLSTGRELWRHPLGTLAQDVPVIGRLLRTGLFPQGGGLQTASGLVIVGATADHYLRAFDVRTGKLVWEKELSFSAHGSPMTYRLAKGDKQFLVVQTGGTPGLEHVLGNRLVAFTLPN